MTDTQWQTLLSVINGDKFKQYPTGFIIDSPWLPNWAGMSIMDYFSSEEMWFQAHLKAAKTFPETIFLPGFWSEFGMCTEPSAFGARCSFPENEFPHAHKIINNANEIDNLSLPDARKDGLLPFMLKRLEHNRAKMEKEGYRIRFSVSRGPLNIATYLMGTTEFLMLMMMDSKRCHTLIRIITDFLIQWHDLQKNRFPEIDGIMMLDDIVGFVSREQFEEFGLPYFKELYKRELSVKLLHNDAPSRESAPLLPEMGVNLFNMGIDVSIPELLDITDNKVAFLGNLPPRDVLAADTPELVYAKTRELIQSFEGKSRILLSCGGGMPPEVSSENIQAMINAAQSF
ncbi:MAG: uroporphyrinogen decarboxylase [Bacteroidetes bacterium]|jgi:uroporphyrinogen-III decarboxylase|nr:uroporphyrinogen decarboxylase [Bacteroidota bacterium]MBT3751543.1 uroporphyrinogen decarboxylase [Bacteroidota bacterium]MBT4402214.1 uroporphyrinogen decarboxylase [Bacteroidota bacterium]MBT4411326.1 uroporphyrinogen decarboxylase [Bacteroidota bacterium]MBT5425415.1 uroporphyrinogen decarboxylase [Bacteroidota bacterium]